MDAAQAVATVSVGLRVVKHHDRFWKRPVKAQRRAGKRSFTHIVFIGTTDGFFRVLGAVGGRKPVYW